MSRSQLTIQQAARLLDAGLISCKQLVTYCRTLAVAGEEIWGLHAYNTLVDLDQMLDQAGESDRRRHYGETISILDGIPMSFKSNIAVRTEPLTAGSRILGHHHDINKASMIAPPVGYDADTVKILLRDKGGILMGTTSLDEFGMGSLGTNTAVGVDGKTTPTKNPLPLLSFLDEMLTNAIPKDASSAEEQLVATLQLPSDVILQCHQNALQLYEQSHMGGFAFSAGGSSSGSAASVAHGSSLLSLGTDTGGSVRLPAAWCGLVGLKPSYGLLSRHGIVSYASSFDTVGILARSVDCACIALDVLAQRGEYSRDSTFSSYGPNNTSSSQVAVAELSTSNNPLNGVKVGIPEAFSIRECPSDICENWSKAAQILEDHGAEIVQVSSESISPDLIQKALAAYYVLVSAEASSNLSRYDGFRYGVKANTTATTDLNKYYTPLEQQYASTRSEGFGKEVARRILCGTYVLSSDQFHTHYEAAATLRACLAEELHSTLKERVDLLLIPTVLSPPTRIDSSGTSMDSTVMFANDIMTTPPSLAGLPSVSVPMLSTVEDAQFPSSMQLIGGRLKEDVILKAAHVLLKQSSYCGT
ncbi:amidase signature domain containing protein [Nitzschia inconspicua]|uniref:Amidase signature domain containing protein n=1 Tax=Nitzschia inconspicua TaxID=303405 RepID=A0A9K3Q4V9_9STRA|nr:amidase signature domain containing protein [Nitzschia inconspicua]